MAVQSDPQLIAAASLKPTFGLRDERLDLCDPQLIAAASLKRGKQRREERLDACDPQLIAAASLKLLAPEWCMCKFY